MSERKASPRSRAGRRRRWLALAALAALAILVLVVWRVLSGHDVESAAAAVAPHRHRWYAVPVALLAFVVLSFALVPVLAMTVAAGWLFGPWLGAACALAGCLGSAMLAFLIGRRLGRETLDRLGAGVRGVSRRFAENGVLGAFLLRKVPAPFVLVNMLAGASRMRLRDFLIGTLLGMGAIVVLLSLSGHQLAAGLQGTRPSGSAIGIAILLLAVAVVVNQVLKRRARTA